MASGITSSGFQRLRLADILTEIQQTIIALFGTNVNLSSGSVFSQLIGTFAEREDLLWQGMEDVYNSQSPDTAFGASLDNIGSLRGIPRLSAKSSVSSDNRLFGTAGTLVPSGTQISVSGSPLSIFSTNSSVTLGAGQNCIQTISFSSTPASGTWVLALGGGVTPALPFNISAAALQTAIQALPFASGCLVTGSTSSGFTVTFTGAGTGGLMVQPVFVTTSSLLNGSSAAVTLTPAITQAGIDQGQVVATAVSTGATIANAGTLTSIVTPVSGLTNVINYLDASIGRSVESDNAYRARMAEQLQIAGAGTVEAIRSKLLEVTGVTAVIVFENATDIADSSGRPPKSFEVVVQGGSDADVGNALWAVKPAGIETVGLVSYTVTDSQGMNHVVKFSRPTTLSIYMIVQITTDFSYPSGGDASIISSLVSSVNALGIGKSVIVVPKLISAIGGIPGIDTATILIGTSPSPTTSNNVIVSSNQIAIADSSRVTVQHL